MADTRQCPNCGAVNDISFSMCQQCLTPLTAYAGQLTGETYSGKLASHVASLNKRPHIIAVMAIFEVLLAIFVPLAIFVSSLPSRTVATTDDAYAASQSFATGFHAIGAVVVGIVMIPLAGVLIWLAWATMTQRTWAWNAAFVPLAVFVIMELTKFKLPSSSAHVFAGVSLLAVAVALFFWYRPATRAWYGL